MQLLTLTITCVVITSRINALYHLLLREYCYHVFINVQEVWWLLLELMIYTTWFFYQCAMCICIDVFMSGYWMKETKKCSEGKPNPYSCHCVENPLICYGTNICFIVFIFFYYVHLSVFTIIRIWTFSMYYNLRVVIDDILEQFLHRLSVLG